MPEGYSNITTNETHAATDMMHRRVLSLNSFHFVLRRTVVLIKTNSALMDETIQSLKMQSHPGFGVTSAEWEIVVETPGEVGAARFTKTELEPIEVIRFGPSCAVRTRNGSWFAHTPPSLSGIGFAMVNGSEGDQILQLSEYLRTILSFLPKAESRSIPVLKCEVPA